MRRLLSYSEAARPCVGTGGLRKTRDLVRDCALARDVEVMDLPAHRTRGLAGVMMLKWRGKMAILGDGYFSVTLTWRR
jgi:hypothetical protein